LKLTNIWSSSATLAKTIPDCLLKANPSRNSDNSAFVLEGSVLPPVETILIEEAKLRPIKAAAAGRPIQQNATTTGRRD
jgi:hypothetical protein